MNEPRALAMFLFDTYSEMGDEDQAKALAALRTADPPVHDALVHLLVIDALAHALDAPPWTGLSPPAPVPNDTPRDDQTGAPPR
jgi:hypothetical protein